MPPSKSDLQIGFQLGPWTVLPERDLLVQGDIEVHIEPMVMDVLVLLASFHGRVVTKDELVDAIWGGRATADEAIATKIAVLRSKLGESSRNPTYVETVQKRGYRLRQSVSVKLLDELKEPASAPPVTPLKATAVAIVLVAIAAAAMIWWPRTSPIDSIESVAVLPFRNLSDDKEQFQYIVDGFREELVVSLTQVPGLKFTRGPDYIGGDSYPDVDAVVTGSLRTDGDKIRITAELISTRDGFQLWGNRFDGEAKDVFSFQERVANDVRDALVGETAADLQAESRPVDPEAFDKYMRGLFFLAKRDAASLERARTLFAETIQVDPTFGPAYLRQAITLLLLSDYKPEQRQQMFGQALAVADDGVAADPGIRNPMQLVRGFVHHQNGNWTAADNAYEKAFVAATPYPTAYHWHSRLLGDMGLVEDSLDQAIAARALEPASQILNSRVAISYLWNNRMSDARHYFDVANTMDVGVPDHHLAYTMFLIREGRFDEARDSVKFAMRLAHRDDSWVDAVIDGLANPDDEIIVATAYATIEAVSADETVPPYIKMTLWALFDNGERIMQIALQQASDVGAIYELEVIYLDEFKELRDHEQFPQLLQALGLRDYWNSIGCQWIEDAVSCDAG